MYPTVEHMIKDLTEQNKFLFGGFEEFSEERKFHIVLPIHRYGNETRDILFQESNNHCVGEHLQSLFPDFDDVHVIEENIFVNLSNPVVADALLEVFQGLSDYPLWDDSDYFERESKVWDDYLDEEVFPAILEDEDSALYNPELTKDILYDYDFYSRVYEAGLGYHGEFYIDDEPLKEIVDSIAKEYAHDREYSGMEPLF